MFNFPQALEAIHTTSKPNKDILLYKGSMEVSTFINSEFIQIKGVGSVVYKWFPSPELQFIFVTSINRGMELFDALYKKDSSPIFLTLLRENSAAVEVLIGTRAIKPAQSISFEGSIRDGFFQHQNNDPLSYVLVHITNFQLFESAERAELIRNSCSTVIQRIIFEFGEWKITLDELENTRENIKYLKAQGGFAITHVYKLEKVNKETFLQCEIIEIARMFRDFLSFARGFIISAGLMVGCNQEGKVIWKNWEDSVGESWRDVDSWFPISVANMTSQMLSNFAAWWHDWNNSEQQALYWYLSANYNSSIEESIILIQVALESIAWIIIVDREDAFSRRSFSNLQASEKLRELFRILKIPFEIIGNEALLLNELRKLMEENEWEDGIHAFTAMRNCLIHAKPVKRDLMYGAGSMAKFGACYLGLWYLELVFLALFEYDGLYANRLNDTKLERVPWRDKHDAESHS